MPRRDDAPSAENGLPGDLFGSPMPQNDHASWGSDPSGYCACQDCEHTGPLPPATSDGGDA